MIDSQFVIYYFKYTFFKQKPSELVIRVRNIYTIYLTKNITTYDLLILIPN